MDLVEALKLKLKKYRFEEIIISNHAIERARFRSIDLDEVRKNIINPIRLIYASRQDALNIGEEKYDCYFDYGKNKCQRYVLIINSKCIVCTVIKINRKWQKIFNRRLR
jgi:hypothetical protein